MQFLLAALALALLAWLVWPQIAKWKAGSAAERAFTVRFTAFVWLVGLLFVAAFIFLPNKGRVIMMLPAVPRRRVAGEVVEELPRTPAPRGGDGHEL